MDHPMLNNKTNCHYCGDTIIGRSDKRFCDSACRNAHNNAKRDSSERLFRAVEKTLRKNYKLLEEQWTAGLSEFPLKYLTSKGFNTKYFTSLQILNNGATYKFCYDIGFSMINVHQIRILKKEKK
jgi:hypothetical protein